MLSDSFDRNSGGGGAAGGVSSGNLPGPGNPAGFTTPVQVLSDLGTSGTDEGRAMLELIHDIAPGASLAFHTASEGAASFAQGILDLANAGADVIVDDVTYPDQPFFQDGIIAQAAANVTSQGIPFFSSAGNQGRTSYSSQFRTGGSAVSIAGAGPYNTFDFDPGPGQDNFQLVALAPGGRANISFQWDQPFASAGGTGAANDMDIFVFDFQTQALVAASTTSNVGGDALEIVSLSNPTAQSRFFNILIAVRAINGQPQPGLLKYVSSSVSFDIGEFDTRSSTLYGHHMAVGGAGIAAADYRDTPEFGVNPPVPQPTTSAGGLPILFDVNGNRLATPEVRQQPRVTGPDNTNTSFFIPGNDPDGDGIPNFSGTSAAAPHIAAVAALMLDSSGGPNSLTPEQIYSTLEQTAIDMLSPGFDFETGFGFVNAEAAIDAVRSTSPPPPPPPSSPSFVGKVLGETGKTTANDAWRTVQLRNAYVDPVVIVSPASFAGSDPVTVRVRNVASGSFQVRVQEWDYLDGNHSNENISYLVVESGTYTLPDGTLVHAGTQSVNANLKRVNFPEVFDSAPVVLSQVQTVNGPSAVVTRQQEITRSSFKVRVQEEQGADGSHNNERVGYVALERGNGSISGSPYRIQATGEVVSDTFRTINLGTAFNTAPVFLASMQTTTGADPAGLRFRNLDRDSVQVIVEEEKSADAETTHSNEAVGYAAFGAGATLIGQPVQVLGETGKATANDAWKTVQLRNAYVDPVVIVSPASFAGSDPVTVRVRNVTSGSFQVRVQEWDYLDGNHSNENISYLVVESGTYTLPDGTLVHAGTQSVNANLKRVNFPEVFDSAPVVLSQVQTVNGPSAVVTRQQEITRSSFKVRVQEEQGADGSHNNERVGYVALERGNGSISGSPYRIQATGEVVSDTFRTINLGTAFNTAPVFLASMQTTTGTDPAGLRFRNLDRDSVQVIVEEEKSADAETTHSNEAVGYAAFGAGATLIGQPVQVLGETGKTTANDAWKTVQLRNAYVDPVVIVSPPSFAGSDPVTVRVRNVTSGSFQVRVQEWDYLDGNHSNENISYLVVESGTYTLPDGTLVHAGTQSVNANLKRVNFPEVFDSAPVVLSQVQTVNGPSAVVTRQQEITRSSFKVRVQEEQGADGSHNNERVGYVALERGNGSISGSPYRIQATGEVVSDTFRTINLGTAFNTAPVFLASMQTTTGTDPAGLRFRNLDRDSVQVIVEEEKSADAETTHSNEAVGYAAFGAGPILSRNTAAFGTNAAAFLTNAATTIVEEPLRQDPNQDGVISALDALIIINHLSDQGHIGSEPLNKATNLELDINNDGYVTALDALMIINSIARPAFKMGATHEESVSTDLQQQTAVDAFFRKEDLKTLLQEDVLLV
ncbi:dockerin type I domain-containing protein [Rhodopirellula sp. P2]|uniref:dockerin type I domain-containing protein n=1 Tax=Rhodopirellula sp. P2 TaxID=2127060 RepID=UPI002368EC8E|nr:dockerin type I domain-containing protein [Rhodopirellula sp. P2]WDQ17489.1 dockerin type I domain-containing protein [Rhodopirellula sp. P2]